MGFCRGLNSVPSKLSPPGACEWERVWRQGLCRCNHMGLDLKSRPCKRKEHRGTGSDGGRAPSDRARSRGALGATRSRRAAGVVAGFRGSAASGHPDCGPLAPEAQERTDSCCRKPPERAALGHGCGALAKVRTARRGVGGDRKGRQGPAAGSGVLSSQRRTCRFPGPKQPARVGVRRAGSGGSENVI